MNIRLNGKLGPDTADKQKITTEQQHSDIEIIADMLRVGENGAAKTETVYTADMSYPQIQEYLEYLINQGFINKVNLDNTVIAYQVTESGLKLLKAIDTLLEMIESTESSSQQPE
jgi:predicted transcriptional regulator